MSPRPPSVCGGRLGPNLSAGQQLHAAGLLTTDGSPSTVPDASTFTERSALWDTATCAGGDPGLWRVSTYARGAIRPTGGASGPLTISQLTAGPLPAGNSPTFNASPLWGKLTIHRSACRSYYFDWGQTIIVHADAVGLSWVAPPQVQEVAAFNFDVEGCVHEFAAFADLARVETTDGTTGKLNLTQLVYIPAETPGAARGVPVPPGAVSVEISRDVAGPTLTTWWSSAYGLPGASTVAPLGAIPIIDGAGSKILAPNTTHLIAPTLDAEESLWQLVWQIEP